MRAQPRWQQLPAASLTSKAPRNCPAQHDESGRGRPRWWAGCAGMKLYKVHAVTLWLQLNVRSPPHQSTSLRPCPLTQRGPSRCISVVSVLRTPTDYTTAPLLNLTTPLIPSHSHYGLSSQWINEQTRTTTSQYMTLPVVTNIVQTFMLKIKITKICNSETPHISRYIRRFSPQISSAVYRWRHLHNCILAMTPGESWLVRSI